MKEVEYRELPEYPGYRIGNDGSIWSKRRYGPGTEFNTEWKKLSLSKDGERLRTSLRHKDGKVRHVRVHSIVMLAFVGPRPKGKQVCHNDGVASNNDISNLRYDTPKGNAADKVKHGTNLEGENHPLAKLTEKQVSVIKRRLLDGDMQKDIANDYDVEHYVISKINLGTTWKKVEPQSNKESLSA